MLITIPWSIPHSIPEMEAKGFRVSFPEEGAVTVDWQDPEGTYHGSWGLFPYDIENYPGVYRGHGGPQLEIWLPKLSPFHVIASHGFESVLPARWQAFLYALHFPSFYGYADNVDQILAYGEPFVSSPEPAIVTIYSDLYRHKNGPYIGPGEVDELEDWEEATEATPHYLHFQFHLLGSAPWQEKISAVERLMKEGLWWNLDVEEIEYASLEPWRQQLRRRVEAALAGEETEHRDLEAEERRIRDIFEKRIWDPL